ncbi:MAG: 23S rRNA (pseudouridine(1915)-N(3))-methyltransferase RlmH [Bdellovibrionaceae bacterium]|nr:23S rRNA (pseudouridine(1915)-N(3))-methyltransferase RlmH [Pseudobdellovibrionaceae bacterium]
MKIVLYHVSTAREDWADEASALYQKKISAFLPAIEEALKPRKAARDASAAKKTAESELILEHLKPDDYVILFDEKGEALDSRGFAKRFEQALGSSKKRIVFLIGGAFGVEDSVRRRADRVLSLSSLTMNHVLAKTVAWEQIYRAFTILKNLPYHND